MISFIKESYKKSKEFFAQENLSRKARNQFLEQLSQEFYQKFSDHPIIAKTQLSDFNLRNKRYATFQNLQKDFLFPHTFVKFLDRSPDANILLKYSPDMTPIEEYLENVPNNISLDLFFKGFFMRLYKIGVPLRRREIAVLRVLLNKEFLHTKKDGSARILPPIDEEVLEYFSLGKKQLKTVRRGTTLLYHYDICFPHTIMMNPGKMGFSVIAINGDEKPLAAELQKFIFWEIPFNETNITRILSIPSIDLSTLVKGDEYIQLTQCFWDFNASQFDEDDWWSKIHIPEFGLPSTSVQAAGYASWDLTPNATMEFTRNDVMVLKNLTHLNYLSEDMLSFLGTDNNLTVSEISKSLEQMVIHKIFQLSPELNFVGTSFPLFIRFNITQSNLFDSIINSLLLLPESIIMTNKQAGFGLIYLKIPPHFVAELLDNIVEFKNNNPEQNIDIVNFTRPYTFSRSFDVSELNFTIKTTEAKLSE